MFIQADARHRIEQGGKHLRDARGIGRGREAVARNTNLKGNRTCFPLRALPSRTGAEA